MLSLELSNYIFWNDADIESCIQEDFNLFEIDSRLDDHQFSSSMWLEYRIILLGSLTGVENNRSSSGWSIRSQNHWPLLQDSLVSRYMVGH
ncbi:hypothetical protein TNCV_1481231 [Trichonephila clavipes]|nr:hypothetical protein TNCV_1481231 [Trichonephila clavipes]